MSGNMQSETVSSVGTSINLRRIYFLSLLFEGYDKVFKVRIFSIILSISEFVRIKALIP